MHYFNIKLQFHVLLDSDIISPSFDELWVSKDPKENQQQKKNGDDTLMKGNRSKLFIFVLQNLKITKL